MSDNLTLALKYRPKTFDEVIGNELAVDILKQQLSGGSKQPLSRSILLHGPTGCGKTTLARIVAAELGVGEGDLKEIDSADFRGIDTIREIRKQAHFTPLNGLYRVWVLDEVHQLTKDAQSALLKILEDTPKHVYFLLCTTDPQKLLPTIRGRCSQFQVQPLTETETKALIRRVVKAEGEKLSKDVYEQIVQDSMGHPRNALQILAQVLAVEEDKRLEVAKKTAETQSKTIELCRALLKGESWKKVAGILKGLKGEDPEQIRRAVLGYCQSVLLNGKNNQAAAIMEEFIEPFYNSGFPGLVFACYSVLVEE
ncbi:MAG: DNA polymerase III subunit tau [Spirochaetes bacterium ADurb.Bin001]|nr:MAG: DNA polymerase III subunit tau [Spirochaetes bacterium ADurb.Bin001]